MMAPKMATTEALVLRERGKPLQWEKVNLSELRPDEALVEMHATGICHTDLSVMSGKVPHPPTPVVLGHEGAGVIIEVGSELSDSFAPGDKVVLSFDHCGHCRFCNSSHPATCMQWGLLNFSGTRNGSGGLTSSTYKSDSGEPEPIGGAFFGQSSFARHAIVAKSSLHKMPSETDLSVLCPLGCGIMTGAGAVLNNLRVTEGSSIAVFGAGSVGIAGIMAARMAGAKIIIAVDLVESRLKLAAELGATHTLDGRREDLEEDIQRIVQETDGLDFAMDTTGVPSLVEKMIGMLGRLGKAALVGVVAPGTTIPLRLDKYGLFGIQIIYVIMGDAVPSKFIPFLAAEQAAGRFPMEKLVTKYPAADYEKAIQDMRSGETIKAVLLWR